MAEPFQPKKLDAAKAMADIHRLVEAVGDGTVYDDPDAGVEMFGKARAGIAVACAYMREGAPEGFELVECRICGMADGGPCEDGFDHDYLYRLRGVTDG